MRRDFLRRRGVREEAEAEAVGADIVEPKDPPGAALGRAVEHLVTALPPKERACVLLKDVFDYSLEEIAELVDSTVGGVKAALNRGRSKLTSHPAETKRASVPLPLLHLYVERFNRRDWDGVRELITADARLQVADRFAGPLSQSPYFGRYERVSAPSQLAVGEAEGEPVVVALKPGGDDWKPLAIIRLHVVDGRIHEISDYTHCPWVLDATRRVHVSQFEMET